jgi:hypothetical protein
VLGHVPGDQVELFLGGDLALLKVDLDFAIDDGAERERVTVVSYVALALLWLFVANRRRGDAGLGRHHLRNQNYLFILSE